MGLVASLAAREVVVRAALRVDGTRQQTMLDFFRMEVPRALPQLPVAVFVDEAEALEWLGGSEG